MRRNAAHLSGLFLFYERLQPPFPDRLHEGFIVTLCLISICNREIRNRSVKPVALAKVSADGCRFAGTGVSACESCAAMLRELDHVRRIEAVNFELDLCVPELAN